MQCFDSDEAKTVGASSVASFFSAPETSVNFLSVEWAAVSFAPLADTGKGTNGGGGPSPQPDPPHGAACISLAAALQFTQHPSLTREIDLRKARSARQAEREDAARRGLPLQKCLQWLAAPEVQDADNMWYCTGKCKTHRKVWCRGPRVPLCGALSSLAAFTWQCSVSPLTCLPLPQAGR